MAPLPLVLLATFLLGLHHVEARCNCLDRIVMLMREDDFRVVSSPEYPRPYCANLDCLWRVVAASNESTIFFFADNLDLRQDRDFILFYENQVLSSEELEGASLSHSCTGEGECRFDSRGKYLTVRFTSDSEYPDNLGFQGTVALYDRRRNALVASLGPFLLVGAASVLVTLLLVALVLFLHRRSQRKEERQSGEPSTSQKLLE